VDGKHVIARDYSRAHLLDAGTWETVSSTDLPPVEQGETLATEAGGRSYLVGSEGVGSPLIRIPLTLPAAAPQESAEPDPVPSATPATAAPATSEPAGGNGFAGATWFWAVVVVGLLAAISAAATRGRG
ncbi:MAG: hypothetical protein ABW075_09625, partial [Aeromicrobium sp.]